ncbi:putative multipass transmembrane protein [Leptomonas seymouri]|uniref:Putative multipass transmembrane protein n=1 Tax=Leptomonas seymouri TaxID=5684 RepID=A0A0N0P257_LEPSE|nr:putative multipass transmembrane protein [Leptomonas seymouri]|eukprot:KPI82569.1 putative multipass transmembrane protein [Leptomonas seymouri]
MKREWASQSVDGNAAKVILLLFGLFFQLLVSVVLFPVDAIPWFGTSDSAQHAWEGFCNSVDFIFASWFNVRHGLLYSLGFAMSFIGCTYLNEHSPTLASVVLQLAGPITSLVIIIVPQWNVYKLDYSVGQQVGGVILLLVAALLYHLWEQESLRRMIAAADAQRLRQQQQRQEQGVDEVEENLTEAR